MPQPLDILLPFAVSLVILLLAWRPWTSKPINGRWANPLALALGFLCMYKPIAGAWPTLPPNGATGWIFYIAIIVAVLAVIDSSTNLPLRWIGAIAIFAASFSLLLHTQFTAAPAVMACWIAAFTIGATLWWFALEQSINDRLSPPLAMLLIAGFSVPLLVMAHSLTYGRLAIALASAAAPMLLLVIWRKRFIARGSALMFVAIIGPLLACGYFFADLTLWNLALLGIAPLALLAIRLPPIRRRPVWMRIAICVLILVIPLALAVAITAPGYFRSVSDSLGGYGE